MGKYVLKNSGDKSGTVIDAATIERWIDAARAAGGADPDAAYVAERLADLISSKPESPDVIGRVKALADAWNETPDYAPSDYDRGRVEQRHDMTTELLATLDAT